VAIPAVSQDYTKGLSLWQHKVIRKFAAQEAEQVDIVALAIAKQKIQDIVKRDWQTSNRGRTKVSMARWLGIGRDGLNTSDVEAFHEEQIAVSCKKIPNNDNSSYTTDDSDPMTGISDYGNSFNNDDVQIPLSAILNFNSSPELQPIDNKSEIYNAETEIVENQVDSSKSLVENKKNKKISKRVNKSRKSKGKSSATATKNISEKIDIEKDEWKPDLSGWSVSYVQ
jgi:putative transposase